MFTDCTISEAVPVLCSFAASSISKAVGRVYSSCPVRESKSECDHTTFLWPTFKYFFKQLCTSVLSIKYLLVRMALGGAKVSVFSKAFPKCF